MSRLVPNADPKWNGNLPCVGEPADLERVTTDLAMTEADLRIENLQLRSLVADLEKTLEEARQQAEQSQREFDSLLEEKSEVIRSLHRKVQDVQDNGGGDGGGDGGGAVAPREQELLALSEELERERRQLKDDEEALMQQMREMEVTMSRERAEVARQRNEILRLQSELRHEVDLASRDGALRERLAPLQRRSQELSNRRGSGPPPRDAIAPSTPQPSIAQSPEEPRGKESGFFRRLFG